MAHSDEQLHEQEQSVHHVLQVPRDRNARHRRSGRVRRHNSSLQRPQRPVLGPLFCVLHGGHVRVERGQLDRTRRRWRHLLKRGRSRNRRHLHDSLVDAVQPRLHVPEHNRALLGRIFHREAVCPEQDR